MENHIICLRLFRQINELHQIFEEIRTIVQCIYEALRRFRSDPVDQSCKIYLIEYRNRKKKILDSLLQIEEESSELSEGQFHIYFNILTELIDKFSEARFLVGLESNDLNNVFNFDLSSVCEHDFIGELYEIKNGIDSLKSAIGETKCEIKVEKLFDLISSVTA
jgi:hypothetical protein